MQVAVERLTAYGNPVHQVWLPPLPSAIELDAVLGPVSATDERGYRAEMWPSGGHLTFPVGVVDLPAQQQQRPITIDLSGAHGHLAVVGAPQSGKSTLLRTALLSAMVTHTPQELQFVCVDFGGGTLTGLERAPHVSGVATRHEEARTRRAMAVVRQLVEERERLFQQLRIDSVSEFRRLRDEGGLPEGVNAADVVLVIDNWAGARAAVEEADGIVLDVAARGLGVGIHLLITANRWMEIRTNLRDNITGRMELRLNEPGESEISRPAARQLRSVLPGRGVVTPGYLFHTSLPRLDGLASADNLGKAQDRIVTDLATCWSGPVAPPFRVLPEHVTPADLEQACASAFGNDAAPLPVGAVPIGLRESDLAPAVVNMMSDEPHFMVFGDPSSGKTSFLRSWMRGLAARQSAWDVRLIVIDYRRSLLDTVPDDYIGARAGDAQLAAAYVQQVAEKLQERMPPAEVTSQQLRERSWWSGPELYVVIDDYDLVAGAGSTASRGLLAPLLDYLTQASDIGFHLVLARRAGGLSRALMSDQVISRLREIGSGGLILSGDPREGVVLGDQRAARQVPGRGFLVSRRHGASVVQTVDPAD
jgi:S-DNA-T family DNA segregation ATPase FtsK/SpoIIIE